MIWSNRQKNLYISLLNLVKCHIVCFTYTDTDTDTNTDTDTDTDTDSLGKHLDLGIAVLASRRNISNISKGIDMDKCPTSLSINRIT